MKLVSQTAAGKKISAFVILKDGILKATVTAHYGESTVLVNVFDSVIGKYQSGTASGGGYDKFTAALSGLTIDGHIIANHCGTNEDTRRFLGTYLTASKYLEKSMIEEASANGWSFANYDKETQKYRSLHIVSGLDRLKCFGYSVIQAI